MKQRLAFITAFSIALTSLTVGCTSRNSKNGASGYPTVSIADEVTNIDASGIKPENDQQETQQNNPAPVKAEEPKKQERVQAAVLETIKKRLEELVTDKKFKGSILIAHQEEVILKKAYGLADIKNSVPNEINTRFMIASMTKQFTAACILMLQEKGALSVDDPVGKYIEGFPSGDKVTIHQLLTHTSGLTIGLPGSQDDDYIKSYPGVSIEQKIAYGIRNKDIRIAFPPVGTKFNYSDVNYLVLSLIVEKASGMPFEDFLKANIFGPLGMKDSGTGYDPENDPMQAKGYGPDGAMLVPGLTCADMCGGAASIYSTVGDMYKWDRALCSGELIGEDSLKAMFTPYNDTYGYGWWFSDTGSGAIPVHGGRLLNGAFSGFFVRDTINDSTAIVLGNDGNHDDKRDFAKEVCTMLAQ